MVATGTGCWLGCYLKWAFRMRLILSSRDWKFGLSALACNIALNV